MAVQYRVAIRMRAKYYRDHLHIKNIPEETCGQLYSTVEVKVHWLSSCHGSSTRQCRVSIFDLLEHVDSEASGIVGWSGVVKETVAMELGEVVRVDRQGMLCL